MIRFSSSFVEADKRAYRYICAYKLRGKKRNALSQYDLTESQGKYKDVVRENQEVCQFYLFIFDIR
jgi:hypothetical protein